ncbi:MAG: glycoside hydrolase family 88 protein, partial [Bacteroidota bacterium]
MKIHQLLLPLLLTTCLASCGSAPKIAKNDIEPALVAAMQWQEKNPRQADRPTDWTHGAYYTGVARAHAATKNPVFTQAIKDHGERNNWSTWERVYHADDVAISYAYLYLNELQPGVVNLEPRDVFLKVHLYEDNRWK